MEFPKQFIRATENYATFENHVPAPYMRKSFQIGKAVKSAELLIMCHTASENTVKDVLKLSKKLQAEVIVYNSGVLEDLTGKVDCVCFHKKLLEFAEILQPDMKVVITGKVQHRGEDQISLLIDNVKSVDNSNIVTVSLKEDVKYEELCGIKNILAKHHGDDPVMIKLPEVNGYSTRIMTSPIFWVNSTNDLINNMNQVFPNKIDIKINSLDKPLEV
jgi:DNA polymerase III alpha subunit